MKRSFVGQIAVLLITGLLTVASADVIYLGTFNGNDSQVGLETLQDQINGSEFYTGEDVVLASYDKFDVDEEVSENNLMTVTYDDGNMSGMWTTQQPIDFYIVKGGTQYAIWWIQEAATSGTWTTDYLLNKGENIPEISHLSAYDDLNTDVPNTNVPEPATLSLLGIGILSIAGLMKRRKI